MRLFLIILVSFFSCPHLAWAYQDSVRTEKEGDQVFVIHRVDEKETLYSLSRKYDVPIYKIIEQNPPTEFGLEIGQVIRIPVIENEDIKVPKRVKELNPTEPAKKTVPVQKEYEPVTKPPKKEYKVHVVEEKQTLFGIARLYNVSLLELKAWNNLEGNDLDIGQELIIRDIPHTRQKQTTAKPLISSDQIHVVGPSETLYSISKSYGITLTDLKRWNELVTNDIKIGQRLVVADPASARPTTKTAEIDSGEANVSPPTGRVPRDREAIDRSIEAAKEYEEKNSPMNFEEVVESGLAEVIEGTEDTRKYLALHRTAKIGTILRVKNDMNNQEVFVRVLGKLPDTGTNQNVLIKLSKAAYNRLGAIDPKFRVTLSYIP